MFILKGIEQLQNAINKARKARPVVKFRSFGNYSVKGSPGFYTVICRKDERGNKTVICECKGAERGLVCYHAAALALHVGIAKQRQATA
ncbi:MAG TPA: SWIM zinc finger family protein [Pyrinomonadaceae bacterium]|jgi:hypothetical protein